MREHPAQFNPQHYALYQRYTAARHEDGDMADASTKDYLGFLCASWCDTRFFEFLINGQPITETELKLIAALAIIGLSRIPSHGYSTPAAIGTPSEL